MSLLPEINQASAEINKFVAQANIHQTIAPVNPAEFTSPADTLLLASRDPVIREVSVGMTGIEAVQNTVSGTPPLSLPNSLGKPLKEWSVDVLPYQEGTGDPSPSNVRPIHGTNKLTITMTSGKNLLNKSALIPDKYVDVKGSIYYSDLWSITDYLELPPGEYVASGLSSGGGGAYICAYDANKLPISSSIKLIIASTDITFTIPENGKYVVVPVRTSDGSADTAQLEFGSIASDYVPYVATSQTVFTLPQTVYTGTIGSDGGESRWGEVILNGTQTGILANWRATETSVGVLYPYSIIPSKVSESDIIPPNILSDTLPTVTYQALYNGTVDIGISEVAGASIWGICIRLPDTTLTTDALVNQYLAEHPITVVYELATPTTFAVPSPPIPTPNGSATTWATAEDGTVDGMKVTYYKSE